MENATLPPPTMSRAKLRDVIADALWEHISANELAEVCVSLGLAPQSPDEQDPMYSKRSYVKRRIMTMSAPDLYALAGAVHQEYPTAAIEDLLGTPGCRGVDGDLRNLIFAANGPKPDIVLTDAINNTIEIVGNQQYCLMYDRPLTEGGLTWRELVGWWTSEHDPGVADELQGGRRLYDRLRASMADNDVEQFLFAEYCRRYRDQGFDQPALIPQVYLHYDPYSRRTVLPRQRMDFLMLLPNRRRIVIEVDGAQHYSHPDGTVDKRGYAAMVAADRELTLAGYEVYRFGGMDFLNRASAAVMLGEFFTALI